RHTHLPYTTLFRSVYNGTSFDFSPFPEICAEIGKAYLRGNPTINTGQPITEFTSPDIQSRIGFDANGYYIDTDGLISGEYYVQYTYTNSSSATSTLIKRITVYAAPVAVIGANNACVDDAIQFNDLSTIPNNTNGGIINKWLWDLDDKDLLSSVQNPVYTYETAGIYDVSLTVT